MAGRFEQGGSRRNFDDLAEIHDRDPVAHVFDDAEIMGDDQIGQITMLLVEHDMDAVFALADRVTVMVYGRVIASDDPQAIRSDEAVRRAYLGDEA